MKRKDLGVRSYGHLAKDEDGKIIEFSTEEEAEEFLNYMDDDVDENDKDQ